MSRSLVKPPSVGTSEGARPKKLILRNFLSPGDIVMLTAAVRDLHGTFPGRYLTDVRTPCPELWENHPHITPLQDDDPEARIIECEYPLIHRSNDAPYHFIHGFSDHLSQVLGERIIPGPFKGAIYLSEKEKSWISQVQEITGEEIPFWIIVAGGKSDFTIKWWDAARWQRVVDEFRGRILFVQVGESHHWHPELRGTLDLRGQTSLRQIVRLVYHAQGVVSPVTFLMHLAAAVEVKGGAPRNRPCVVVAGGREPAQWEAYPHHQFIHMNGALSCCDNGGCWKSRAFRLEDGDGKDDDLCVDVVPESAAGLRTIPLPRCMDMISAEEVVRRIELYFAGGAASYLDPRQTGVAFETLRRWKPPGRPEE